MLQGALIGLGNIAVRGHVPAYLSDEIRPSMKLVAVMDVVAQNREKAGEYLPGARFYAGVEALLAAEKLDFVDICTPPHTHAAYLDAFAARGIHCLCEKPLVEHASKSAAVERALRDANVVFMPCHQYKYSPLWRTIHDLIRSGELGVVTTAQFNVYRLQADSGTAAWNPQWRTNKAQSGGGILVDTGAHYFYLAQYFFGIPKNVSALLRTLKHADYGVEDTASVVLEYPGMLMQMTLTWAASARANSVFIAGSKGSLSYDGTRLVVTHQDGTREIPMPDVSDKKQYVSWYASLLRDFHDRIAAKNTADDLLVEASNVMKLLDLSYRSSEEHRIMPFA
ncbi:MAG TPA: Gfo/Idh/MocA family oxidoreductase [Patescibacteria group bacterium]|nr:Gfo/Idh/MocA family oxidoreductase [Patescibacteria group bacterium]